MMSSLNGGSYSDAASSSSSASGDSTNYSTNDATAKAATTAAEEEHKRRRKKKKKKQPNKSQHSLDHLRQRVSHLMSIFEEKGWFIPMPDPNNKNCSISNPDGQQNTKKSSSGKVWSNRNYGADKKRQRKASERFILESRILQLETVLQDDYGVMNI